MVTSTHYIIPKVVFYVVGLFLVVLASVTAVIAQNLVQPDGRINQVAHFGGDALYCVDQNMNPTNQYSGAESGGFRLLSLSGQELWYVPAETIAAAVAQAKTTNSGVLVATGNGTYGPTRIDTYVTSDGDDYFVFSGYDEYGKPNSLEWKFCTPVGPMPQPPGARTNGPFCTGADLLAALGVDKDAFAACSDYLCPGNDLECLCSYGITYLCSV